MRSSPERKRRAAERRREQAWRRAVLRSAKRPPAPDVSVGAAAGSQLAVVMCLWRRPERFEQTLRMLESQLTDRQIRLLAWNNARETAHYRTVLEKWKPAGALHRIDLFESDRNIGGIARFLTMRMLRKTGYSGPVITVDDDQNFTERFVDDMVEAYKPEGIAGWWAFRFSTDYWARERAQPGEEATYVGTGGAVFDSSIVDDLGFFSRLPPRFGFLEDLWASQWVRWGGGKLTAVDTKMDEVQKELNQHHDLVHLKPEFATFLASAALRD